MASQRTLIVAFILLCLDAGLLPAARFSPPEPKLGVMRQLEVALVEINEGNPIEAAKRFQSIYSDPTNDLQPAGEGVMQSLALWVEKLKPMPQYAALAGAYQELYGAQAQRELDALKADPTTPVSQFCRLTQRYPMTTAAKIALAEAGTRASYGGDFETALECFAWAKELGWAPSDDEAKLVETIASRPQYGSDPAIPFGAPWHGDLQSLYAIKAFPRRNGEFTFLASSQMIAAMRGDGSLAWNTSTNSESADSSAAEVKDKRRFGRMERGWISMPAIYESAGGSIVIARQRSAGAVMDVVALRARDGRILWTTRDIAEASKLEFVSEPVVRGRHVYVSAIDLEKESLALCALDVMTGEEIWRTSLGSLQGMPTARNRGVGTTPDEFLMQTAPLVRGRYLYITPSVSFAYCINRIDGSIRWIGKYTQYPVRESEWTKYAAAREKGEMPKSPLPAQQQIRWNNTPRIAGNVLVVAPLDMPTAAGFDVTTGAPLWHVEKIAYATLIGTIGNLAILSGDRVTAIDVTNGEEKWVFYTQQDPITGPAAIIDGKVLVPRKGDIIAVGEDGKAIKDFQPEFEFNRVISEGGQDVIRELNLENAFKPWEPKPPEPIKKD